MISKTVRSVRAGIRRTVTASKNVSTRVGTICLEVRVRERYNRKVDDSETILHLTPHAALDLAGGLARMANESLREKELDAGGDVLVLSGGEPPR